jgi:hypothetical protein
MTEHEKCPRCGTADCPTGWPIVTGTRAPLSDIVAADIACSWRAAVEALRLLARIQEAALRCICVPSTEEHEDECPLGRFER